MNNDLISRSALLEIMGLHEAKDSFRRKMTFSECHVFGVAKFDLYTYVVNAPAVDAEPVRHGRWLKLAYDSAWTKCSECGCNWERGIVENCNMIYCPNCGAKMDVEVEG